MKLKDFVISASYPIAVLVDCKSGVTWEGVLTAYNGIITSSFGDMYDFACTPNSITWLGAKSHEWGLVTVVLAVDNEVAITGVPGLAKVTVSNGSSATNKPSICRCDSRQLFAFGHNKNCPCYRVRQS